MTVRFVADENFNRRIIVGLQRRTGSIDVVRVQDVGLRTADDPEVLRWAADAGRVLLTHDIATMPDFAYERITAGQIRAPPTRRWMTSWSAQNVIRCPARTGPGQSRQTPAHAGQY